MKLLRNETYPDILIIEQGDFEYSTNSIRMSLRGFHVDKIFVPTDMFHEFLKGDLYKDIGGVVSVMGMPYASIIPIMGDRLKKHMKVCIRVVQIKLVD